MLKSSEIPYKGTHPTIVNHYSQYKCNNHRKAISILGSTFEIDSKYEIHEASIKFN